MEKFRIAQHRAFHVDGHDFLLLTRDNAIFEMDSETREFLEQSVPLEEYTREELYSRTHGADQEKAEFLEGLAENHLLVRADSNSVSKNQGTVPGAVPLNTLVLHVTDACNLGCDYCYYCQSEPVRDKKRKPMTSEVAQKAIDFLFEHSEPLEKVTLVFFGGEPLLNFDLISFAVSYANETALEREKKVDFAITTNGTLLTDRIIRFLHENKIGVTVSMDGSEDAHDRFRKFPDGTPSYKVILPKIRKLLGAVREKPVVARVTVAKDAGNVPEILDHLLGLGFSEAGFAPVTTQDPCYQLSPDEMNNLLHQFRNLSHRFLEVAREDGLLGFTNLIDLLAILHEGEVKNYPCGAGLGLFSVGPDGDLYLCQRLFGEDRFCMGDIFTGFDQEKIRGFRTQAEISQKQACKDCWARTACAGGCYHEALLREGNLLEPNLHYCEWIRDWFDIGLQVYGQLALDNPEYLDKLSVFRGVRC